MHLHTPPRPPSCFSFSFSCLAYSPPFPHIPLPSTPLPNPSYSHSLPQSCPPPHPQPHINRIKILCNEDLGNALLRHYPLLLSPPPLRIPITPSSAITPNPSLAQQPLPLPQPPPQPPALHHPARLVCAKPKVIREICKQTFPTTFDVRYFSARSSLPLPSLSWRLVRKSIPLIP